MDLETLLSKVKDERTFLAFVDKFKEERPEASGQLGIPLDQFVEQVKIYAVEEAERAKVEVKVAQMGTPWRKFANFLYSGQMFE